MIQTMQEANYWLASRPFGTREGIDHFEKLLDRIDHPEKNTEMIHIAGTNGKGSTLSFLRGMLQKTGFRVGSFISPHIEKINERIAIDDQPISDHDFIRLVAFLQPIILTLDEAEGKVTATQFEILTAMAFLYFDEKKVDLALIEVGLGGLSDSTNVISPLLTAITTIGLDHMEVLGDTIEKIAAQKAGIIKEQVPVVTGKIPDSALAVIAEKALTQQAQRYSFTEAYQVTYRHPNPNWGEVFDFTNEKGKIKNLLIPMVGRHQVENAGCAIELYALFCQLKQLPFQEKIVRQGLQETFWPVRLEKLSDEPLILLDGAHNTHAMKRLVETMQKEFSEHKIHILFSALDHKEIVGMLQELLKIRGADIYLTRFDYAKAIHLEKHYEALDEKRITTVSLWQVGLADLLASADSCDLILVTGSLYFIGEVRTFLKNL